MTMIPINTWISYRDIVSFPWDGWIIRTMRYKRVGCTDLPTNILVDLYVIHQGTMFYIDDTDWEISKIYGVLTSPCTRCDIRLLQEMIRPTQHEDCITTECKTLQEVLSVMERTVMLECL